MITYGLLQKKELTLTGDDTMRLKDPMPSLEGATETLNGEVNREQLIGSKPILIHFWAVSCHLCKKAMPNVNEFRDKYKDKLHVISIYMPRTEEDMNMELIQETAKEHDITQPILIDGQRTIATNFGNKYMPAYYLFDKNGEMRHYQAGGSSMQFLEKRLNRMLNEIEADNV